jgi:ADP-glucose pyrophosphorylase
MCARCFACAQDYSAVVAKHRAENADITVVSHGIPESKVGLVGVMKIDPATGA